jgi:hypothetical protein
MASTTATTKLGITIPSTNNPDYEAGNAVASLATAVQSLETAVLGAVEYTVAGAVAIAHGSIFLKAGSAAAMTLVAPTAGTHDGVKMTFVAEDAYAYTLTTPSNKINGNKHIATWTAAIGNSITLVAFNGIWYPVDTPSGVALT